MNAGLRISDLASFDNVHLAIHLMTKHTVKSFFHVRSLLNIGSSASPSSVTKQGELLRAAQTAPDGKA